MTTPYFHHKLPDGRWLIPRDPIENLKWRIRCREKALEDSRVRDAIWQMCMDDLLAFMSLVCWGYDPRSQTKVIPFIPYPHQESVFLAMDDAIDRAAREERSIDVILDKARAQGGTFGYLWIDLRRWLRDPMFSAGYVTRNEDLVDSKTDSSTVLWKIAWALEMLPAWMCPAFERNLKHHTFLNNDNGALIRGYAAGQDVAAGGRASVFTIDEAGARDFVAGAKDEIVQESLHDVTNCVAAGTLVVTDYGLIPIEAVELHHRVWDGIDWVSHEGCVFQGEQETISSYGINLTPEHLVLTVKGWKYAREGYDRAAVRLPDSVTEEWCLQGRDSQMAVPVRLWQQSDRDGKQAEVREYQKLWLLEASCRRRQSPNTRHDGNSDVQIVGGGEEPLQQPTLSGLRAVRRAWNCCVRAVDLVRELLGRHGRTPGGNFDWSDRQRRIVLPGQLPMGNGRGASEQPEDQPFCRQPAGQNDHSEPCESGWRNGCLHEATGQEGCSWGCFTASIPPTTPVYDLLNCGPRAAFTVVDGSGRPLLAHNCIRMVSARYTDVGVFHEACENPDTAKNGVYLVLDWKDHPIHGKNSYVVTDDRPVAVKPEDQEAVDKYHAENPDLRARLERKGFKFEGRVRSPWYNHRCLRPTSTPRLIASQLDRSPRGAVGKVFSTDLLDRMKRDHCQLPVWQGQPVFDSETLALKGLLTKEEGPLKLWFRPGIDNTPPLGPFTAGCDIASGGVTDYATNSTMSAIDDRTGEQVLEYAVKGLEPRPFARRVVGLCIWLRNALLGWEDSGVSGGFAKEVMEVLYYGNVFFRDVTQLGSQKKSRKPGWPCRDADKADMFEQMALAMEIGRYTPRSEDMVTECGEYEWDGDKIIHAPTKNRGATGKNHADRAVAGGGSWLVYASDNAAGGIDTGDEKGIIPEYGSFLWREQQERSQSKIGSPRFGIRDVVRYFFRY